jgi:hypothetical protein
MERTIFDETVKCTPDGHYFLDISRRRKIINGTKYDSENISSERAISS